MSERVDVVVIGMGPGGEHAAETLAEAGLKVVGIDRSLVGGECPYWGCIPSKMMIRAANLVAEGRRVNGFAGTATVQPDWTPVHARVRDEATDDWDDRVAVERFENKGGTFVRGQGALSGPHQVSVEGRTFEAARAIVLNPGTSAAIPPIPGLRETPHWTNHELIEAAELPASLAVLGGGAIGMELSQTVARFGVKVTVIEALDRLLSIEEPEAGELLADVLREEGLEIRTGARASKVAGDEREVSVTLEDGDTVSAERLLVATGRTSNIKGLGLEHVGVDAGARFIPVDARMRVSDGVWAIGDATGKGAFTHISMYQAQAAIADILGKEWPGADYSALPRVTFTDPEIGAAGLTEAQARQQGVNVRTGSAPLSASVRGWIHGPGSKGLIKLVEDADAGVLVGATACGPWGGEVLSMLTLAIHARVPTESLRHMIYAYPTFHRNVEDALKALNG